MTAGKKVDFSFSRYYELFFNEHIELNVTLKEMLSDWILDEWDPFTQISDRHLHSHDINFTKDEDELLMEITYYAYDGQFDDCYLILDRKDLKNHPELCRSLMC